MRRLCKRPETIGTAVMNLPISVCMIAKNEEQHIEECFQRLKPYQYETVFVDTGSTDRTLEIAANYTDRIYHFDWIDDFGAARNYALSLASHDWILCIDCDEYLEALNQEVLGALLEKNPCGIGQVLIRNRTTDAGTVSIENVRVSRLFNRNYFHFTGKIHEQLTPVPGHGFTGRKLPVPRAIPTGRKFPVPITLLHVGYDGSEKEMRQKSLRNITMLEKELAVSGPDPYLYFQLGQSHMKRKEYEKAYEWFDLGLSMDIDPGQDYVKTMVESYGYCLLNLKRYAQALQLANIYDIFAVRADFVFLMGLIYMNNALLPEAIAEFKKSTTMEQFSVEGVNSYRANYNIGVIYECSGHPAEAEKYYKKCGDFPMALARLDSMKSSRQL